MTGIIDVGGGLRGIYGAGVLDRCMDDGLRFDVCVGVSAGSANMAAFLAGQRGRNYLFYTEYAARRQYMGAYTLASKREYIDLDYVYGTLSNEGGDSPLDYDALMANPSALCAVATDAATGEPVYFSKEDLKKNDYRVFNASCAMPVACKPQAVGERYYCDGGVADPVPVERALAMGCDFIVLVLTRPVLFTGENHADQVAARVLSQSNPSVAALLRTRGQRYRQGVAMALDLEKAGRCRVIAPTDTCGVGTVTRDRKKLRRLYFSGYHDARVLRDILQDH